MNASNWMKRCAAIAGSALMGLMFTTGANAANPEPVVVEVTWIAPISLTPNVALKFGLLDVGTAASDTVTINTDDTYSELVANTVVGGTQAAADLTITVAASTPITILADNHQGATYYTLDTWMCSYDGLADVPCDVPYNLTSKAASSGVLEIGATLHALAGITAITDDSTFDVTVTYQ